jgi:transposase
LGNWGYNRDKKKGKKQVVAGLLCDDKGNPIALKLFQGNTLDFNTVHEQIQQLSKDFGCKRITFVGDRGMIKSKQIEELESEDYFYITAITKPQIETLLKDKILQLSLFDKEIKEVECDGVRYISKKNPARSKELSRTRHQKQLKIEELCSEKNEYLREHKKAKPETAIKEIQTQLKKLNIDGWLNVDISTENVRELKLTLDSDTLADESHLDGCYVIKSNLPEVSKEIIHDRYNDLKYVEQGFRCMKTDWLEMRPWYVRREDSTRGHAYIVMISNMLIKYLRECWKNLNITVEEGLKALSELSLLEVKLN